MSPLRVISCLRVLCICAITKGDIFLVCSFCVITKSNIFLVCSFCVITKCDILRVCSLYVITKGNILPLKFVFFITKGDTLPVYLFATTKADNFSSLVFFIFNWVSSCLLRSTEYEFSVYNFGSCQTFFLLISFIK